MVAHLTLNAEALAGVLTGLAREEPVPMYRSAADRDQDIAYLALSELAELRERFLASTTQFATAVLGVPPQGWAGEFERVPGGPRFPHRQIVAMRHREVEVHHADLDAGYTHADWPEEFLDLTFNSVVGDREGGPAMLLRTPDGDVPVSGGAGPVVTGSREQLTWWLLGRGSGAGLGADPALPELPPWR